LLVSLSLRRRFAAQHGGGSSRAWITLSQRSGIAVSGSFLRRQYHDQFTLSRFAFRMVYCWRMNNAYPLPHAPYAIRLLFQWAIIDGVRHARRIVVTGGGAWWTWWRMRRAGASFRPLRMVAGLLRKHLPVLRSWKMGVFERVGCCHMVIAIMSLDVWLCPCWMVLTNSGVVNFVFSALRTLRRIAAVEPVDNINGGVWFGGRCLRH
jgi:hypothetical protein